MFRSVTTAKGETAWINPDHVRMVVDARQEGVPVVGSSLIVFDNGAMEVKGTPYNVVEELKGVR